MLDIKYILENEQKVKNALSSRGVNKEAIDLVINLYNERRKTLSELEDLRHFMNEESKAIGRLVLEGKDPLDLKNEMREVSLKIKLLEDKETQLETSLREALSSLPNLPDESVPFGEDENSNVEIRKWGEVRKFHFNPKPHWEIGENLGIIDFQNGAKLAGSKYVGLKDLGAALSRKLINFMVELALKKGYTEISPPFLVKREVLFGSGQLPKFEDDLYKIDNDDLFLIPTGEVPLVNYHSNEVIDKNKLPLKYVAYTPCFRREAGAAGKEGRGLIRVHQFDKVELVRIVKPENSEEALNQIVSDAEDVLKELNLPYRVMLLCTADMTAFSTSKTFDIEVWFPSLNKYVEISSCSNCKDFQARRANIRYRDESGKLRFVHTLNGSGVAVGRCLAAIIENYQNEDGTFEIPQALR
jgi:seryl-tRNA synthetase